MTGPLKDENAPRKFIDLIWMTSRQWAVWDPTDLDKSPHVSLSLILLLRFC